VINTTPTAATAIEQQLMNRRMLMMMMLRQYRVAAELTRLSSVVLYQLWLVSADHQIK
jgi:hypothetical protein